MYCGHLPSLQEQGPAACFCRSRHAVGWFWSHNQGASEASSRQPAIHQPLACTLLWSMGFYRANPVSRPRAHQSLLLLSASFSSPPHCLPELKERLFVCDPLVPCKLLQRNKQALCSPGRPAAKPCADCASVHESQRRRKLEACVQISP